MKVLILGATGSSGLEAVRLALHRGWDVVAGVRNPGKLESLKDKLDLANAKGQLQIAKADIFSSESLVSLMADCDCVLSCLGPMGYYNLLPWANVTFYSRSGKCIVEAMKQTGVNRLLFISSWCTVYKSDHPIVIEWFLKPFFLGRMLADMGRFEDFLAKTDPDEIDYTSVRPPGLANGPPTQDTVVATEGQYHPEATYQMPRVDVAAWMLNNIENKEWNRKCVAIGVKK